MTAPSIPRRGALKAFHPAKTELVGAVAPAGRQHDHRVLGVAQHRTLQHDVGTDPVAVVHRRLDEAYGWPPIRVADADAGRLRVAAHAAFRRLELAHRTDRAE